MWKEIADANAVYDDAVVMHNMRENVRKIIARTRRHFGTATAARILMHLARADKTQLDPRVARIALSDLELYVMEVTV